MRNKIVSMIVSLSMILSALGSFSFDVFAADLPANKAWVFADDDITNNGTLTKTVLDAAGGQAFSFDDDKDGEPDLYGYGEWTTKKNVGGKFTHNGATYEFKKGWNAGSGGPTKRCFYFQPKGACIVTVAYAATTGRPMFIYQDGKLLASGESPLKDGILPSIDADIEDPSKPVYIYGGSSDKQLCAIFVDYYDPSIVISQPVSGKITYNGTNSTDGVKVVFTDTKDNTKYETALQKGENNYSIELRQNRDYTVSIADAQGKVSESIATALSTSDVSVRKEPVSFDINVVDIAMTEVNGDVVVHNITKDNEYLDLSKVQLTFKAKDDDAHTYTTGITDNKIKLSLMPNHEYEISATGIDGYEISNLSKSYVFAPGDTTPFKNILFTEQIGEVPFTSTIEVGPAKTYTSIRDAIKLIKNMKDRPAGKAGRVSIVVDPGTYVEQVYVDTDYVTIKAADPENRPVLKFYYGIGYLYYSSAGDGFYNEDWAVQKTKRGTVQKWGCTVYCPDKITGFIMEDIIVFNTLNCELLNEEIGDGVVSAKNNEYSDTNNKPDRIVDGAFVENFDPKSKANTERAAAICPQGKNWELYNCDFISSQDTFGPGGNGYVKNCYIEGATDYICGGNSIVFEGCTLAWHGYSNEATGGYITACKDSSAPPKPGESDLNGNGFYFKNSVVTTSKYYPNNKFAVGSWGRNWGGVNCQCIFQGVKLEGIGAPGAWVKMGGELSTSVLYVDDVTDKDGKAVDTSGTSFNPNGTMEKNGFTPIHISKYFGSWVPSHYDGDIPKPTEYVTTYWFGKSNGAKAYALEGANGIGQIVGETNMQEDQILKIDATAGKFNNSSRNDEWAQVNVGTKFTIPVKEGAKVTFGSFENAGLLNDVGINYSNGKVNVAVKDNTKTSGELIKAIFENSKLKSVDKTPLTFADGKASVEKTVEDGAKLYVWNSAEGMQPLETGSFSIAPGNDGYTVPAGVSEITVVSNKDIKYLSYIKVVSPIEEA